LKALVVLDASALVALLQGEKGHEIVAPMLDSAAISAVNYSEVIAREIRRGAEPVTVVQVLQSLRLNVVAWDESLAAAAADLSDLGWSHGLSLGDRACLATARKLKVRAVTADREWANLPPLGVKIQTIR
jgi:PIN domain nuclease of toxin-antitoxin system